MNDQTVKTVKVTIEAPLGRQDKAAVDQLHRKAEDIRWLYCTKDFSPSTRQELADYADELEGKALRIVWDAANAKEDPDLTTD